MLIVHFGFCSSSKVILKVLVFYYTLWEYLTVEYYQAYTKFLIFEEVL